LFFGDDLHIFMPEDKFEPQGDEYTLHIIIRQVSWFGPFPLKFEEIVDPETLQNCSIVQQYINANALMKPFIRAKDPELDEDDKRFICRIMKIDPRDRPTATELLRDKWLQESVTGPHNVV
jgi:casein kinase II subunit alpha